MSVRTSSRKNKGQNKYLQDILEQEKESYVKPNNNNKKKENNNNTNNDNNIESIKDTVRCKVCNTNDENYNELTDKGGDMIQCDKCDTWQHIKCMTGGKEEIDEFLTNDGKYYCQICDPERYPHLIVNQKEGSNNNKQYDNNDDDNKAVIQTASIIFNNDEVDNEEKEELLGEDISDNEDYIHEEHDEADYASDDNIGHDSDDDFLTPRNRTKRKQSSSNDKNMDNSSNTAKKKKTSDNNKISTNIAIQQQPTKEERMRENAVKMFTILFEKFIIPETLNCDKFILPDSKNISQTATDFAKELEEQLYLAFSNPKLKIISKSYPEKVRILFSNLKDKKNIDLKCHVVNKDISFEKLVKMNANELANPDLQHFKKKRDTESLTQLVIDRPEKPLYIKTHRGDELLDSTYSELQEDILYSKDAIRRTSIEENVPYNGTVKKNQLNNEKDSRDTFSPNSSSSSSPALEDVTDMSKVSNTSVQEETQQLSSDTAKTNEQSLNPSFSIVSHIRYPDISINFSSNLQYIGCSNKNVKNPYREALGNGELFVEGRLAADKAFDYLRQVKSSRNILAYYMEIPKTECHKDAYCNLADSIILNNKVLGVSAKKSYEKNIYIIAADSGESHPLMDELFNENDKDLDMVKFSEQKIFVLVVVKPELVR